MTTRIERRERVPADCAGLRLDQALARMFPEHSRARLQGWIRAGSVTVDGDALRARDLVAGGELVALTAEVADAVTTAAEAIPLEVVHRDPHILVIDKPAGLVVHPGAGRSRGTLQNALLHLDPGLAKVARAGIVHRIDKDTTGLLVVARTPEAHTALVAMLAARELDREYEAIAWGVMISGGKVDAPIGRNPVERKRMAIREDGRRAVTHYRVIERFRSTTHVACKLDTGRTHQIRVHLQHIGHPIVGDPTYGKRLQMPRGVGPRLEALLRATQRQMLHARKLGFAHPIDGHRLDFEAPTPADMRELLDALREDARQGGAHG
jgi:23S rRNA pseudouridine1911/1915/1917 synthase